MAYRGTGPFPKRLPVRTIAVFPSYDVIGFAVRASTGITSLAQIGKDRIPLRISTGVQPRTSLAGNATMFTISAVLSAAGFSLTDLRRWGAKFHSAPRPSDPSRRKGIETGAIDAIFDEGIKSWGKTVLEHVDKRRIRIAVRNHGHASFPFPPITQPHAGYASIVIDKDFFHMMDGADLPAAVNVSTLQYLRDRMRAAAR